MDTTNEPASLPVKPEIGPVDAILALLKYFIPSLSKIGVWRPLVVAALAYFGYDNRQNHARHQRNERAIEEVKSFVQAPPINGRKVFESSALPPLPPTNRTAFIHRK